MERPLPPYYCPHLQLNFHLSPLPSPLLLPGGMAGFVLALFHKVEMKYRGPVDLVKDIYTRLSSRKEGQGEGEGGSAEGDPSVSGGGWWAVG